MIQYVTNYNTDSFLVDYNIYRTYINNNPPTFELGQTMAFQDDPAIFIKIVFTRGRCKGFICAIPAVAVA